MLRSFRLGNHRSFADEQELLLMPASPSSEAHVVPVTAVYGANASGKSNLLYGLRYMQNAVLRSFSSWGEDEDIARQPFRLGDDFQSKPSVFVVELIIQNVPYTYGFELDDVEVREEWLYAYPEGRQRVLFQRTGSDITFGSTVRGKLHSKLEVMEELTRPNALFLSTCAQANLELLKPVYHWFRSQLRLRPAGSFHTTHRVAEQVARFLEQSPENSDRLVALLSAADVGITDVVIKRSDHDRKNIDTSWTSSGLIEYFLNYKDNDAALAKKLEDLRREGDYLQQRIYRETLELAFLHGKTDEPFGLMEESAGTRSWLQLLPMVLEALDSGLVVAVDEIDTSLHPLLTARLVSLFQNPETNPNSAQLIFTTHDASLLGTMLGDEVLSRDQIWFVEKKPSGGSTLYPLTDFKPRKDQNTERRYLGGSYGAVPVLDPQDFVDAVRPR